MGTSHWLRLLLRRHSSCGSVLTQTEKLGTGNDKRRPDDGQLKWHSTGSTHEVLFTCHTDYCLMSAALEAL